MKLHVGININCIFVEVSHKLHNGFGFVSFFNSASESESKKGGELKGEFKRNLAGSGS
jgi:hypothetical protein